MKKFKYKGKDNVGVKHVTRKKYGGHPWGNRPKTVTWYPDRVKKKDSDNEGVRDQKEK